MDAAVVREYLHGKWARHAFESDGDALYLGAELAGTGELVGDLMLRLTSAEHRGGELGYVFHPAFAGHGYATEAAHRLLHLGFDHLGLHRVIARIDADNHSSARLARRLGMRQEARLVENEWFKGRWGDELDFAMLDREWQALDHPDCVQVRSG
jgi:RimJ/RimL family protein N-acetyltransferase